jgi:hypothetical protein
MPRQTSTRIWASPPVAPAGPRRPGSAGWPLLHYAVTHGLGKRSGGGQEGKASRSALKQTYVMTIGQCVPLRGDDVFPSLNVTSASRLPRACGVEITFILERLAQSGQRHGT